MADTDFFPKDDRAHASIGGSWAAVWMKCPGSAGYARRLREIATNKVGEPAVFGTIVHRLVELGIEKGINVHEQEGRLVELPSTNSITDDPLSFEVREGEKRLFKVTEKMVEHAARAVELLNKFDEEYGPFTYKTEQYIRHSDAAGGTADIVGTSADGGLVLLDIKTGRNEVQAERNPQLLFYASGLLDDPSVKTMGNDKPVILGIISTELNKIDLWPIYMYQLRAWKELVLDPALEKAVAAYQAGTGPLVCGEHCRFCPAVAGCAAAQAYFNAPILQNAGKMDGETIAAMLELGHNGKLAYDKLRSLAMQMLMSGTSIPGYKLGSWSGSRTWKAGAKEKLYDMFGLDAFEPKSLSAIKTQLISPDKAFLDYLEALCEKGIARPCLRRATGEDGEDGALAVQNMVERAKQRMES